jgi:hypothetical protein
MTYEQLKHIKPNSFNVLMRMRISLAEKRPFEIYDSIFLREKIILGFKELKLKL